MKRKQVIVVGSGAGGAMAAKELQRDYDVTILEAGRGFHPFSVPMAPLAAMRKTGLFLDERMIQLLFPNMKVQKTPDMVLVRGKGLGGTTTLATGNAVRYDGDLKAIGIDLEEQFAQLYQELPITTAHQKYWNPVTRQLFDIFDHMGLNPQATPKFLYADRCTSCGQCAVGCRYGAKWDSRALIDEAVKQGAQCITGCKVTDIEIKNGTATAVHTVTNGKKTSYHADLVVLAAGGMGTPQILASSGIPCSHTLFVDPVLCVAAPFANAKQNRQISMPFISQQDGYILSPYMDWLSFFFHKAWRHPMQDIASVMIKLADDAQGGIYQHTVQKTLTPKDCAALQDGVQQSKEILKRLGADSSQLFLGTVNAGHPGGMLPLTERESRSLHHEQLPENLYIADATLLPKSMGNPPMLTIMALSKRIAQTIKTVL